MLVHLAYRIIEQSRGINGPLAGSQTLALVFVHIFPIIAIAVSTTSPLSRRLTSPWPTHIDDPVSISSFTTSLKSEHELFSCSSSPASVWEKTQLPVMVVDLEATAGNRREQSWRKQQLVADPEDLW